jgi:hypothetical protein
MPTVKQIDAAKPTEKSYRLADYRKAVSVCSAVWERSNVSEERTANNIDIVVGKVVVLYNHLPETVL